MAGDLNVALTDLDMFDAIGECYEKGSCSFAERRSHFDVFPRSVYIDAFRYFHPNDRGYTFYSYAGNYRAKGKGLRIDYVMVDRRLEAYLKNYWVDNDTVGSDHLTIGIDLCSRELDKVPIPQAYLDLDKQLNTQACDKS